MDVLDVGTVAARVEPPPGFEARPAAVQRGPGGPPELGRLEALATWWAQVAPERAGGPERVRHLWLSEPVAATPALRAEVTMAALGAPAAAGAAFAWGIATADDAADEGTDLLLLSVPDAPGGRVLGAHLLALDPVDATGWPSRAGLDDDGWTVAVAELRDGLRAARGMHGMPGPLLSALASPALAAATGLLLQAAARRTPVLLDGEAAAACALLAHRCTVHAHGWWQAAHGSGTVLHDKILTDLRLDPLTRLAVRTEDGTGARLGLAVLEAAASLPRP